MGAVALAGSGEVAARLSDETGVEFLDAADALQQGLDDTEVGRVTDAGSGLLTSVALVRDAARKAVSGLAGGSDDDTDRKQAAGAVQEKGAPWRAR